MNVPRPLLAELSAVRQNRRVIRVVCVLVDDGRSATPSDEFVVIDE